MSPFDTTGENLASYLRQLAQDRSVEVRAFGLPRDRFVATRRLRLHYLEWGYRGAMPVIFAHPGRLNAHSWDLVSLVLKARYRCIALDVPGHGDSEWAPDKNYSLARFAQELHDFASELGIDKFVLVGASQGGLQALAYALSYPLNLRGLVLLDAGPQLSRDGVNRQAQELAVFEPQDSFESFVRLSVRGGSSRNLDKLRFTLSQNVRQRPDGKWIWKFDPACRENSSPAMQLSELESLMPGVNLIQCPVLILHGEKSDILGKDDAERLASRFPHGRWATVPGAHHLLHHDNPGAVIAELETFAAKAVKQLPSTDLEAMTSAGIEDPDVGE